ncbi:bifunctional DNA primase/polymerase [Streptomyces sp. CB02009]|uniref:bifunctional DNA primase/polymerase n=1 Tax=Streptomyces sp. CB02009 TaxID=1703938 RepID=UPI0009A0B65C|nr:bifunctional DNA primase/polymerase [Streptomyces sp. CB02009]
MAPDLQVSVSDSTDLVTAAPSPDSLLVARWCASLGWPVHPLAPGRKTPAANCPECRDQKHDPRQCPCREAGRWCHGFHAATLDMQRIHNWWGPRPQMGVGVSCGPAQLVVIDIDAHSSLVPSRDRLLPGIDIANDIDVSAMTTGFHTLAVLAALRGQRSPADDESTLRVRTPSGGLHVWYRSTDSRRWQCSSGSSTTRALAWQVDVRAEKGYIIAPGTSTEAGTYLPFGPVRTPAPLPAWLALELQRTHHLPAAHVPAPRPVPGRARQAVMEVQGTSPAESVLATVLQEVAACGATEEGAGFSEKLNKAAYTVGGLVAGGHLRADDAHRALIEAARVARPGQERRAEAIIRSGMTAGSRRPLQPGSRS